MLHEIEPHAFDINMAFVEPCTNDSALLFHDDDDGRSLVKATLAEDGSIEFPTCESFGTSAPFTYLFAIDERAHFLIDDAKFDASLSAGEDTASQSTVQTHSLSRLRSTFATGIGITVAAAVAVSRQPLLPLNERLSARSADTPFIRESPLP